MIGNFKSSLIHHYGDVGTVQYTEHEHNTLDKIHCNALAKMNIHTPSAAIHTQPRVIGSFVSLRPQASVHEHIPQ